MTMKRTFLFLIAIIFSLSLGLGTAAAKGKGKGKGKPSNSEKGKPGKGPSKDKGKSDKGSSKDKGKKGKDAKGKGPDHKKDGDWRTEGKFRDKDRSDFVSHWSQYSKNPHGLPPGLAKNLRRGKPLPPGWDKKLRSGWKVDRDTWDLFDRVPGDYLPKDLKLPKDTGMFLYGDRMVRVHEPTREVVDFVRIPSIKF